jgi:3'-phosphoadenosine 5'-phosphosulfate (PAPS) 3'-phosphatase
LTKALFDFRSLEPEFHKIAKEAVRLRATFDLPSGQQAVQTKSNTGDAMLDVVTIADYHLQKLYLELLLKTELRHCRLLAEESNSELDELGRQFTGTNGHTLCLDPVDGTQRFVEGSPYYASIVSIRDDERPLYSWICYPALDWSVSLDSFSSETVQYSSDPAHWKEQVTQDFSAKIGCDLKAANAHLGCQIVYTAGEPHKDCPEKLAPLAARGLAFCKSRDIGPYGAKFLLLVGATNGYFVARPNPYDGLLALHFAQLKGFELQTDLAPGILKNLQSDQRGLHYGFQYLVLAS